MGIFEEIFSKENRKQGSSRAKYFEHLFHIAMNFETKMTELQVIDNTLC